MPRIHGIMLAGVSGLLLSACVSVGDPSSPYTTPKVGSVIQLNQEISARNGVRIYLQDGQVLSFDQVEKQQPYCQFYVDRASSEMREPLTVAPDTFTVERVYRQKDFVALQGLQLAMGEGEMEMDHGSSQRTMSTYMELNSNSQPNVASLICSQWADPALRYHVSIEEIIRSLGDIAQYVPAG